jgi:hypothetical protein
VKNNFAVELLSTIFRVLIYSNSTKYYTVPVLWVWYKKEKKKRKKYTQHTYNNFLG